MSPRPPHRETKTARLAAVTNIRRLLQHYRAFLDPVVRADHPDADQKAMGFLLMARDQLDELIAAESLAQGRADLARQS